MTDSLTAMQRILVPLAAHYEDPAVEEIAVVAPTRLYRRLRGTGDEGPWEGVVDERLGLDYLTAVVECVGNVTAQPKGPVVFTEIAANDGSGREHRFMAAIGPNVGHGKRGRERATRGVAICIRQGPWDDRATSLDQWGIRPGTDELPGALRGIGRPTSDRYAAIIAAARSGQPMLFSGPTGSGKTTLLNMLLREIDRRMRVVTVEDTAELQVPHGNHTHLYIPRVAGGDSDIADRDPERRREEFTGKDVINAVKRMTPDVVIVGEIAAGNAQLAAELSRTGHRNFWTSIHARNRDEAAQAFADAISHEGHGDPDRERATILDNFVIIQTDTLNNGQRIITGVHEPAARA